MKFLSCWVHDTSQLRDATRVWRGSAGTDLSQSHVPHPCGDPPIRRRAILDLLISSAKINCDCIFLGLGMVWTGSLLADWERGLDEALCNVFLFHFTILEQTVFLPEDDSCRWGCHWPLTCTSALSFVSLWMLSYNVPRSSSGQPKHSADLILHLIISHTFHRSRQYERIIVNCKPIKRNGGSTPKNACAIGNAAVPITHESRHDPAISSSI